MFAPGEGGHMQVRDQRGGNWFWMHNEILDRYGAELGPIGIAVYAALARHANNGTGECYPSRKALAKAIGASVPSVDRALARLRDLGLVSWEQRRTVDGDLTSNAYTLLPLPVGIAGSIPQMVGGNIPQMLPNIPQTQEQDSFNKTTTEQEGKPSSSSSDQTWDSLKDEYGDDQVRAAIIAAPPEKRSSIRYVRGILANWQREGRPPSPADDDGKARRRKYVPVGYESLIRH